MKRRKFIRQCFKTASQSLPAGEPLDWLNNQLPRVWKLNNNLVEFNWD